MKAFVLINVRTGEITSVVKEIKKISQVEDVYMTFGPYDAIAIVQARDLDDLGKLLAGAIQPIPGVEETLTCLAVEI